MFFKNLWNYIVGKRRKVVIASIDAVACYNRGIIYYCSGKYQKAIDNYTKAIELDPEFAFAYFNRGIAYTKSGEYQKAIDDYTKAIELNPEDANVYYTRGIVYAIQKLPTTACDDFCQAGLLYLKQGNRTQSIRCVDLMKRIDPLSFLTKKLIDKIYKKPKKIYKKLKKLKKKN